jgi:NADH-quinone oxidoreductase subunit L
MTEAPYLWLLLLFPLLGSATAGALHLLSLRARRRGAAEPGRIAGALATAACAASCAVAIAAFLELRGDPTPRCSTVWSWIHAGPLSVDVTLVADRLSSVLLLVITGVGALIHAYAMGYMKGDPGYAKFFAYLNLFVAAMLLLVASSNLLGLFVGWEGVGLCSYLLIGFWFEKGWPAEAGQKAFVVNRIGDACFLLGTFVLFRVFGTLDIAAINAGVEGALSGHAGELALAALLLFGGCCGKSAQFPLFTWLPDAMAGPTPVSALIHAATMVTSGIYLVVRLSPLFAGAPAVMGVIAATGALTALIGGSSALRQNDLKGVLAYSTVSQLGYMFLALGCGAFASAVFHLVTHAFFKALLFLGAGSVIHGLHGEQDLRRMGGLKAHMPLTCATFLCGAAALSGLPLTSGFFSKDEILAHAFAAGGFRLILWAVGVATAALTAFYTWRMVALTFSGRPRFDEHHVHPHESPPSMTAPLVVLAALALLGGLLGLPPVFHARHLLGDWLAPATAAGTELLARHGGEEHLSHGAEWALLLLGAAVALVAAHLGFRAYRHGPAPDDALARRSPGLAAFLGSAWGIDAAYKRLVVRPVQLFAFLVAVFVDQLVIDGAVNGSAALARGAAQRVRRMSDGSAKTYALWMGAGTVFLALLWILGGGA